MSDVTIRQAWLRFEEDHYTNKATTLALKSLHESAESIAAFAQADARGGCLHTAAAAAYATASALSRQVARYYYEERVGSEVGRWEDDGGRVW